MDLESDVLDKAIVFAVSAHRGAKRKKSSTPYILHPLEAAVIASRLTEDREILAAAVLHDVIEDTPFTEEDLLEIFGERIVNLVRGDTEDKRRELPPAETWKQRKQETLDFAANRATEEQKIIIFADKLANMRSIYQAYRTEGDHAFDRFHVKDKREHGWYYRSFLKACGEFRGTDPYEEYRSLVNLVFGAPEEGPC